MNTIFNIAVDRRVVDRHVVDPLSDCTVDIDEIKFMLEEVGLWSLEDK
jgi:hypothetical protein